RQNACHYQKSLPPHLDLPPPGGAPSDPFGAGPTPSPRAATSSLALVAGPSSRIGERLPRDGNELPIEARRLQSQLEHAEGGIIADHAVRGPGGTEREEAVPARAGDDLDDALHQVQVAARVLRREAFVVVGMAVHDEIGVGVIEVLQQWLYSRVPSDHRRRRVERLVPEGQRAGLGVSCQIVAQPRLLGAARSAADHATVAVENDDVPSAEVE